MLVRAGAAAAKRRRRGPLPRATPVWVRRISCMVYLWLWISGPPRVYLSKGLHEGEMIRVDVGENPTLVTKPGGGLEAGFV